MMRYGGGMKWDRESGNRANNKAAQALKGSEYLRKATIPVGAANCLCFKFRSSVVFVSLLFAFGFFRHSRSSCVNSHKSCQGGIVFLEFAVSVAAAINPSIGTISPYS